MINPDDPPEVQVERQAKIIDALMRRANRQNEVGPSAYRAFQSAIELQQQVAAQSRELESVRIERERTQRRLAEALSSMDEGFALFSDRRLDICNALFRTLLPDVSDQVLPGLELAEYLRLLGRSAYLVSADHDLALVSLGLDAANDETSVILELTRDRWYQMSLQQTAPGNLVALLTEITLIVRRNRSEKKHLIDRQADYLQAVFQNMSAGVCTFSASGEVKMQNGRFRDILGVPLTMLQPGTPLEQLLDFMHSRELIANETFAKVESWRKELSRKGWMRKRVGHGADRVLDVQAHRLPDGGFLVELTDVTLETRTTQMLENRVMARTAELTRANARLTEEYEEKARVEEELRLAKERAEAAVSSKTRFLAAASHDLLQPINAAKLLISTLKTSARDTGLLPVIERLDGAFISAEQLLHSLLDLSRLESADPDAVTPTEVSLGALIDGVYADQSLVAAQKNVRLDVVPCSVFVRSDPVYLLRSIQNLVVNAIQYTDPGGRVLVGLRRSGDKAVLQVWDTGIGIAQKDQKRIFEEFARADNVPLGSGMGLGLSVVDRACRHLGHRLWLRSKPGEGSVFNLEMDVVAGQDSPSEPRGLLRRATEEDLDHIVLVIENDRDVLFGMTQWLQQCGASVLAAHSRAEALAFIEDMGMPPDIVLADYQLDNDDGLSTVAALRKNTGQYIPAILITADRSETLRRRAGHMNISVLTKPVKLSRLRQLIDWNVRRHPPEVTSSFATLAPTKVGNDSFA